MKKASLFKHFALCMAFQAAAIPAAMAQEKPPEPARADRYASIVIDAQTGQTLYERDGNQQLRPASTTKIMTAYLTFEALRDGTLRLDQELSVSRRAASQERTNLAMIRPVTVTDRKTGKKRTEHRQVIRTITVEDALKGMLVHSGFNPEIEAAAAYQARHEAAYGPMNGFSPFFYDGSRMLFAAIQAAGTVDDTDAVREALRAITDFEGVQGPLSWSGEESYGSNQQIDAPFFIARIENGAEVIVATCNLQSCE